MLFIGTHTKYCRLETIEHFEADSFDDVREYYRIKFNWVKDYEWASKGNSITIDRGELGDEWVTISSLSFIDLRAKRIDKCKSDQVMVG